MSPNEESKDDISQKILITGASGLIGTALTKLLRAKGHQIIKLSFTKKDADSLYWNPYESILPITDFSEIDVVINLAGETVNQLWTEKSKKRIYESRVIGTRLLADAITHSKHRPKLFISASGASCYEIDKKIPATEESAVSETDGFLEKTIMDWEDAAKVVKKTDTRLVLLRTGLVLSVKGGGLLTMLPIFKAGLGGSQGSGDQLISWIDIDDMINAIYFCIINQTIEGPVNMVAPQIVTNREFTQSLAKALHRPAWFRVPRFLLKLVLGEFAEETILRDMNVYPKKLINAGFQFKYETLKESLDHLIKNY